MATSILNLVNNLAEGNHRIKCKYEHDNKKCETCGVKYIASAFLNTKTLKII